MDTSRRRRLTRNRRKDKSPAAQASITDLPEAILLHILSFLPAPDAIRISVVAPPWRNLWHSLPTLDFDMHYFQKQIPGKSNRLGRLLFAEFVTQALCRLPSVSFQKFKLRFFYINFGHIKAYVDSWIFVLVNFLRPVEMDWEFVGRGVSDLRYDIDEGVELDDLSVGDPYVFHIYDFESSSIEVVKFTNCRLGFPRDKLPVTLHSIKKVHLDYFHGDADEIEELMASCVNLETFVLEYCGYSSELNIVSGSLRHLTLNVTDGPCYEIYSVEICTPKLESIEIVRLSKGIVYDLKHVSSLVEASFGVKDDFSRWSWWDFACWTNVVSFFTGVKRLTINNIPQDGYDLGSKRPPIRQPPPYFKEYFIEELKGAKVFSEISSFHNLIHLTLKTGYLKEDILSLEVLLNKSPLLETVVLVWDNFSHRRKSITDQTRQQKKEIADSPVALQIPCLRVVKMEGYLGTKNELYVVDLLKKHGVVLEKIVAFPAKVKVGEKKISPPSFLL